MKMLLSLLLTQCAVVHGQTCTPSSSSIINDFSSFAGAGHTSLLFVTIEGECDADMYAFYTTKLAPYAAALGNNMTTTYHKLSATNPLPSGAGASCADNNAAASTATSGLYPTCNAIPTASCTDTTYGAAIRAACPVRCSVCPSLDDYTQIWIADFSSTDAAYAASEWALVKTWFNAQTGREVITDGRFAADALRGGVTELRGPNLGSTTASTGSLEACDGECDDTSDCLLGLSCFERENGEPIPGCSGTGTGKDWDYCYAPAMAIYPEIAEGKVCFPDSPWLGDAPSVGSAASQPEGYPSGAVASKIPQLWKNYVDVLRAKEHGGLVLLTGAGIFFNPDQKTPQSAGTGGYGINQLAIELGYPAFVAPSPGSSSWPISSASGISAWKNGNASFSSTELRSAGDANSGIKISPVIYSDHHFIWMPQSGRGTIVKIDTDNGDVKGEFYASPANGASTNPSRCTVGDSGALFSGLRGIRKPGTGGYFGAVVKIGDVASGGCVDRNGNGVIDTSAGVNQMMTWGGSQSTGTCSNTNTADCKDMIAVWDAANAPEMPTDECILMYILTPGTGIRGVAIDKEGNMWAGGYSDKWVSQHNGKTGAFMQQFASQAIYGLAFTPNNWLHMSLRSAMRYDILKYNPTTQTWGEWIHGVGTSSSDMTQTYGMTVDKDRNVYGAADQKDGIARWNEDGTQYHWTSGSDKVCDYPAGITSSQVDGDVWMACRSGNDANCVARSGWNTATNQLFSKGKICNTGGNGVGVDSNGKIWYGGTSNYASSTMPTCGTPEALTNPPLNKCSCPFGGNYIGRIDPTTMFVDLRVCTYGGSYTYGDMTGNTRVASGGSSVTGEYRDIIDSGTSRTLWTQLFWNEQVGACAAAGACDFVIKATEGLTASVRAFDDASGWRLSKTDAPYTEVTQSGAFLKVPQGRYLQVEFVLSKANLDDFGPTLFNARAKFERALQGGKAAADTSSPLLSWCASCPADAVMSPDLYATSHFPDAIAADFGGSYAPSNDDLLPVSFFTDASSPAARVGKQTITSTVRGSHWLRSKVLNATIIEPACDDKVAFLDASLRLVSAVNGDAGPFTYEWTHVHSGTVLSTVAEQFYPSSSDKLWQGTAGLSGGALFTPGEHSVQLKVRDSIGQEVIATTSFKVTFPSLPCTIDGDCGTTAAPGFCVGTTTKKCCKTNGCNDHGDCQSIDNPGTCVCSTKFAGDGCDTCADGYFDYPHCRACDATTTCSGHGTCKTSGVGASPAAQCTCATGFATVGLPGECDGCVASTHHRFPICEACSAMTMCSRIALQATLTDGTMTCTDMSGVAIPAAISDKVGEICTPTCDAGFTLVSEAIDAKRVCTCAGSWSGQGSTCEAPTFYFNELASTITSEGDALSIKVQRAMPAGGATPVETRVRVQSTAESTATAGSDFTAIDAELVFDAGPGAVHERTTPFASIVDGLWEESETAMLKLTIISGPGRIVSSNPIGIAIMENDVSLFQFAESSETNIGIAADASTIAITIERTVSTNVVAIVGVRFDLGASTVDSDFISFNEEVTFDVGETTKEVIVTCVACISADTTGNAIVDSTLVLDLYDIYEEDYEFLPRTQVTIQVHPRTAMPTAAPSNAPTTEPTPDTRSAQEKYIGTDGDNQVVLPVLLGVAAGLLALLLAIAIVAIIAMAVITTRLKRTKLKNQTAMELDMTHLNVGMTPQSGIAQGQAWEPSLEQKASFHLDSVNKEIAKQGGYAAGQVFASDANPMAMRRIT